MSKTITIGTGKVLASYVLTKQLTTTSYISSNSVWYLVVRIYCGITLQIAKDTPEGLLITSWLTSDTDTSEMCNGLVDMVLDRIPKQDLVALIATEVEEAFERGRQSKTQEVQSVLLNLIGIK